MSSLRKINPVFIFALVAFAILVALSRFLPHPPNFTPVLALFIFVGALAIPASVGLLICAVALFGSDLLFGLYEGVQYTYLSYAAIYFVGMFFGRGLSFKGASRPWLGAVQNTVFGGVLGSALFFLVSNFGVWKTTAMYAPTWEGLLSCYIMALPFFHYTVVSTLGFLAFFHIAYLVLVAQRFLVVER